ncbi:MAG: CopG family transcriptional regulator [Leptolyngbya foveolarum]|uniref:CopG family transcriptional regulator n=1 Tax=Leptolyngbya foveolarum TaxID=47253 RepID=A0A2W4UYY4_9CYAN|nr:MAG: CopG family transcriptional regulator [Leptolyngbya foveolarum]
MEKLTARCSDEEYEKLVAYCKQKEKTQNTILCWLISTLIVR